MSKLKNTFSSELLKSKFSELLESIDRNNTSKMIVEKFYGSLSSLEVSEGTVAAKDAYSDLVAKGISASRANTVVTSSILNEAKTSTADSFLLGRIEILESAVKELKAYSWMPQIGKFIEETNESLNSNRTFILIESVMRDLEVDKNRSYYTKAINLLRESSNAENPVYSVLETMESEQWIPLVKRLYEYCNTLKGSITGVNPNFKVSKIYSPVEAIDENTFVFHSSNKMLEVKDGSITESEITPSDDFKALVSIAANAKFGVNEMRLYPNNSSVLDIRFGEETKVFINNKIVESSSVETQLITSGFVNFSDKSKLATISRAISEGSKIKEIDFGYTVNSSVFEGLSATVFTLNDKIYIQKVNKGMKENSLVEATSGNEAVQIVKDFMNYDITESVKALVESENTESKRKNAEIERVENRIKFILEKIQDVQASERVIGKSEIIDKAKELLETQLKEQNSILETIKNTAVNEATSLTVGGEYTVKGNPGYIYQGVTDGIHIFNSKSETDPTPLHMKEEEFNAAVEAGEISK